MTLPLTLLNSTDLIEELLPRETQISFGENFLAGSDLSISDLSNSSFFLNALNQKKLENAKDIEALMQNSNEALSRVQEQVMALSQQNIGDLVTQLESMPKLNLVQLSGTVAEMGENIRSTVSEAETAMNTALASSGGQLDNAASQIESATQTLSFAAGAALAAASYSLDQTAQAISNTIAAGVAVDLEAASQGMGFDSFADSVDAYNQQYGTNYTPQSAREALGQ